MIKRVVRLARRLLELGVACSRDLFVCTYAREDIRPLPDIQNLEGLPVETLLDDELIKLYESNHFDLLGCGWRDWSLDRQRNQVNRSNRRYAARVAKLIGTPYKNIDWHLEPRAGYRYPANRWSRWIMPASPSGVDIKLPWELSRMQHLVPLALSVADRQELLSQRAQAFRNQVLDFIASNPPRFGVNWRTPMDVAIRAANWVMAFSIYRAAGHSFDEAFERVLGASLIDHGRHIVAYMEWDPNWRGNHYLANQCGLVIIAAALPSTKETDAWLAFSVQELHGEGLRQICADGGVFEASTGYHRLSLEMVVYAAAVALGVQAGKGQKRLRDYDANALDFCKPLQSAPMPLYPLPGNEEKLAPFSPEFFARLAAAAEFTRGITMLDGRIPLIGDNDSGRFIKARINADVLRCQESLRRYANLQGVPAISGVDVCPVEEQRDVRYLGGLLNGILDNQELADWGAEWLTERQLIRALCGGFSVGMPVQPVTTELDQVYPGDIPSHAQTLRIDLPPSAGESVRTIAFTDFGLYLLYGPRLFLAVRCGPIGQDGFGGHAHNDQLSLVLQVDGRDLIADPGVYRYTVNAEERRRYRSVQAHFAPRVGVEEPGDLSLGPWRLGNEAQAQVEYFAQRCFQGMHLGYGKPVHRRVSLEGDQLLIADWGEGGLSVDSPAALYEQLNDEGVLLPFCPAYGVQHA